MAKTFPLAVDLDLGDIQGDILRAYGNGFPCTSYAFVTIEAGAQAQAREWLRDVVDHVTTAAPWPPGEKPLTTLNVAVTAAGLKALGVHEGWIEEFSEEFRHGMAHRADAIGDVGPSAPAHWEGGLGRGKAHVLLVINARTPERHQRALAKMEGAMAAVGGVRVLYQQGTALLEESREHFGFGDGFAQPAVEGTGFGRDAADGGTPMAGGEWRALAPGEFLLGAPDEDTRYDPKGRLPSCPTLLGRNGTYMVWRKLHQDVALWRRTIREAAALYAGGDEAKLAAKVVGRWANGAPLITHPDAQPEKFDAAAEGANGFRYADDPGGLRCPLGAHIRRSNPRDALGWEGSLSFRHRMIRRGMPYGPPLPKDVLVDDGAERGLVFVCFQASISRQFEGVQVQWLNAGNIFGLGHDSDFLLGSSSGQGKMTVHGSPPYFLQPQGRFVTTRGGEYLFVPGMTALAALADGTVGPAPKKP
jgi:Dyp-type peroxidase family